jgi:GTPase Era involved in 16S rRNA processing
VGKSSLINALIDEQDLLPVGVDITTALISAVTYGQEEKIHVVLENRWFKRISRDEIPDYVTVQRIRGNPQQATMLIVETPRIQSNDWVLVDTPSLFSMNTELTIQTSAFIPNADIILFISDALAPLNPNELSFIQNRIISHCQNPIFVITKIDLVRNYSAIVESDRDRLVQTLVQPREEITIIPVSSKIKLEYLETQDPVDLEDSNFAELAQTLKYLSQHCMGK